MNNGLHTFLRSALDEHVCAHCRRAETEHICEACGSQETHLAIFGKNLLCNSCLQKEYKLATEQTAKRMQEYEQNHQPKDSELVSKAAKDFSISNAIQTKGDVFNAEILSLPDLKKEIDEDESIPKEKKHHVLIAKVRERFTHYQAIITEYNEKVIEAVSRQKALQTYLNSLAPKLTAEERANLKLADITYQPKPAKVPSLKPKSEKKDQTIREYARLMNISYEDATKLSHKQKLICNMAILLHMTFEQAQEYVLNDFKAKGIDLENLESSGS